MIHPNRTYLLQLKEKRSTVSGSLSILKARRQALLFEFLASVRPFLSSRRRLRELFAQALHELRRAKGEEGEDTVASLALVNTREDELVIEKKNILGVGYFDVVLPEGIRRPVDGRHYDYAAGSPHLEEAADRMEAVVEAMLSLAAFEIKVRRLGEEILRVSRRARVLEERILPDLAGRIRSTAQYIGEREREEYFRLKRFKNLRR
ncbi:MAG: V-type ATP synthase subunit D [Desulfobulbaceae bacterium]|jgi:V/A-type H+-transporting ATPase subunit D